MQWLITVVVMHADSHGRRPDGTVGAGSNPAVDKEVLRQKLLTTSVLNEHYSYSPGTSEPPTLSFMNKGEGGAEQVEMVPFRPLRNADTPIRGRRRTLNPGQG